MLLAACAVPVVVPSLGRGVGERAPGSGPPGATEIDLTSTNEVRTPNYADMKLAFLHVTLQNVISRSERFTTLCFSCLDLHILFKRVCDFSNGKIRVT